MSRIGAVQSSLAAAVTVFEDGHFIFVALEETGDILLMGQYDHQGYGDGKAPVKGFFGIKYV